MTELGEPWTPVGQNDAITWPELAGLYKRVDLAGVERHLRYLKASGVTCLRLMLEYCQTNHRLFELRGGRFNPALIQVWDDLFRLCEEIGLWILLTPFDTFFLWIRWKHHPYNKENGGPCASRTELLTCPAMRSAVKARLAFATERWGGSGALFALGSLERNASRAGRQSPDLLLRFHRRRRAIPSPARTEAARPGASANRLRFRTGARVETVAQ